MEKVEIFRVGSLAGYAAEGSVITFDGADGSKLRLSLLTADIVRVRVAPNGVFQAPRSWSIVPLDDSFEPAAFDFEESDETYTISTTRLVIKLDKATAHLTVFDTTGTIICDEAEGASWDKTGVVSCQKRIPADEHYYGLGERTGLLDKLGRSHTNWTVDRGDHGPTSDNLYVAMPFMMALRPGAGVGYGLYFNNSYKSFFDLGRSRPGAYHFRAAGGELDYYLINGPTPAQILEGYTALTGRIPLPPRWALGYQQCRYSYETAEQTREVAQELRSRSLPCDTLVLDIDYMDGYRIFTWDNERFPDPAGLMKELHAQDFKVVTINDPGVKYEPEGHYAVYESGVAADLFLRNPAGTKDDPYLHTAAWPGDSVLPDFSRADVRQWWADLHQSFLADGIDGIWNDMNEPAIFEPGMFPAKEFPLDAPVAAGPDSTGWGEIRNLYALLEDIATQQALQTAYPDKRPFVLSRSGFAGIQKYAATWTGDNSSYWEHLEMAMPMLLNLGLSGVAFCGTDIGGFGGNATGELFARWMQLGVLFPFSRGHSAKDTERHEPYVFGDEVEAICRRYLNLRYSLMPYLYTLFEESSRTGAPILRPLLYDFYADPTTAQLHDQVMLGSAIMAAPIYLPGREHREVYIPEGLWYDFWNNFMTEDGPRHLLEAAPLDTMPMYIKGGSIIPFGPEMQSTAHHNPAAVISLAIYPDANDNATGTLYEDDGEGYAYQQGNFRRTVFTCQRTAPQTLQISASSTGTYQTGRTSFIIDLPDGYIPVSASMNGQNLQLNFDEPTHRYVVVPVNDALDSWTIEVKLG